MKKRLLLALVLVIVLSLAFATPVFAGDPPKKMPDGSMPEAGEAGLEKAMGGIITGYPHGWLYGIVIVRDHLLNGYIPRSPYSPQH